MELTRDFPLFPLRPVALPSELVPLHIFEERYKAMIERCLDEPTEFGIVWVADDGLRPIGCACEVAEVLERFDDGRINPSRGRSRLMAPPPPGRRPGSRPDRGKTGTRG